MCKKPGNEIADANMNIPFRPSITVSDLDRHSLPIVVDDATVADGSFKGIARQVFNGIAISVKGFDDLSNPFCLIEFVTHFLPAQRICVQILIFGRKLSDARSHQALDSIHHFPAEYIGQSRHRKEEVIAKILLFLLPLALFLRDRDKLAKGIQTTARYDHMNVKMRKQFL